jgi:branched-chain amino acid transport system ATP-binding protein
LGGEDTVLLEVRDLTAYYGKVKALEGAALHVERSEIVALIGPNGAGKSTALKAMSGLIELDGASSGRVIYNSEDITGQPPYALVRRGLSLVPEGRHVFPTMSVQENLEMGGFTLRNRTALREGMERVFELFPVLKERRKQRAGTLSSGEQQMLAMGRGLMLEPKLLLLDEPSIGLSPNYVDLVFDKIKEINKDGASVLLVEQNAQMALETAHRAYVFDIGRIAFSDTCANLLTDERIQKTFLGA